MTARPVVLVDAHAHLYPAFDLGAFLDGAWENFRRGAAQLGRPLARGVLLLAQTAGDEGFERLAADPGAARAGRWALEATGDPVSLAAGRADGARLLLVCGRQVRTSEGLELLALATRARVRDGLPLAEALAAALAAGALPVLPWGVGKWLGRRGRIVRGLVDGGPPGLAFGDSGNRPALLPEPALLRRARRGGLRLLPGSDPLPLASEQARAGRLGVALDDEGPEGTGAAALAARLADPRQPLTPFGRLESAARFVRNQLLLRLAARAPAALLAGLCLTLAWTGCGGSGPTGPERIDIGENRPEVGWAFGDSLSHGRDSLYTYEVDPLNDAGPNEPGYRRRLEELMAGAGRPITMVEDGDPGSFSSDGVARIGRAIAGRPAFLVLLYGTNDAYVGLPIGQLESNLRFIVDRCRRNKIIVVLCTIPPICDAAGTLPRIDPYAAAIRSLGKTLADTDPGVLLADLDKAFRDRGRGGCGLLNPLGAHPTREGYELIADTVFEQLEEVEW